MFTHLARSGRLAASRKSLVFSAADAVANAASVRSVPIARFGVARRLLCDAAAGAESDHERQQAPPWRRPKPWRWEPEEDERESWLWMLPREQEEHETGRTLVMAVSGVGICVYFLFFWWRPRS
mmetsp:Transcript_107687/g.303349  ORF Transcript_107687/g.303349 Transcript_107687/m.303349 type:complete len:124 (+) Transcript_107687:156-527(+)